MGGYYTYVDLKAIMQKAGLNYEPAVATEAVVEAETEVLSSSSEAALPQPSVEAETVSAPQPPARATGAQHHSDKLIRQKKEVKVVIGEEHGGGCG